MLFRPGTIRIPFDAAGKARDKKPGDVHRIELDPEHDRHARAALEAYADSSANEMPWLAEWLRETTAGPDAGLTRCAATVERVFDLAHAWAQAQPDYARPAWEHVRGQLHAALRNMPDTGEPSPDEDETAGQD